MFNRSDFLQINFPNMFKFLVGISEENSLLFEYTDAVRNRRDKVLKFDSVFARSRLYEGRRLRYS